MSDGLVVSASIDGAETDPGEVAQQVEAALADQPYLLGAGYSAADLLCAAPFAWFGDRLPATPAIRDWAARCQDRPSVRAVGER